MNKKLFLGMFAAAGMLLATSCSNDELDVVQSGNEAQVTFSLGLEGGIATRAISDGTGADVLMYAVFDKDGKRINTIQKVSKTKVTFPTTEKITLAKGQTYKVAFWAQDEDCEAYTVSDDMQVTVSYANDKNKVNNDETRDAFFKTVEFTVSGNQVINVELKRPFAQINVGVYKADWDAAVASGITIKESSVVVKNAATSIDLVTGEVGEETTDVEVSYAKNTIPNEDLKVDLNGDKDFDDENEKYHWLSMSYILVADRNADTDNSGVLGDERATLESLQYIFYPESGNNITFGDGLNSVPVERNWRTNILGQILTGDIQFNITINPIFEGDINVDAPTSEVKSDAQALAAALTANEEDILVVLGEDVNLPINLLGSQTPGSGEYKLGGADTKNITIDLNGKTLNLTTSYMSAIGAKNADATITIKNGAVTSTGNSATTWNINDVTFANCNYVIENVTFNKEVALTNAGKSVTMNDVTINGTGDYYALWISAKGQTVKVDNLKINTSGRGIKIDEQYVDAPAMVTLNINNSAFKTSKKAAVMVKSVEGATINWGDGNDISEVNSDSEFAVWVDEDAKDYANKVVVNGAYVKVEGTGDDIISVGNAQDLKNALNSLVAGNTVVLDQDIDLTNETWEVAAPWQGSSTNVVFDGGGHKITGLTTNGAYGGLLGKFNSNGNITIKNLVLENVTITGDNTGEESSGGALIGWIENHGGSSTITIENVKVNGIKAEGFKYIGGLIGYNEGTTMNLTDCSVNGTEGSCLNSTLNDSGNYKGHVGGLLGLWNKGNITNCEVKNLAIKHGTDDMTGSSNRAGALVGTKYSGVTVTSATVENVTVDGANATTASLFGPNASQVSDSDKSNVTIK